jgi:flagellar biosynthesis protein FlhB
VNKQISLSLSNRSIGLILLIIGVLIVLTAIFVAFNAFYTYKLPELKGSSLEELISSLMNVLIELALRLGFLGLIVWAASILLKHGVSLLK